MCRPVEAHIPSENEEDQCCLSILHGKLGPIISPTMVLHLLARNPPENSKVSFSQNACLRRPYKETDRHKRSFRP